MTMPWIAAFTTLAVLTVLNSVLLLALGRYIGALVTRLPEPIALELSQGPELGTRLDGERLASAAWERLPLDPAEPASAELLVFLSTRCSACLALLDDLNAFTRDRPQIRIVAVVSGDRDMAERMRSAMRRVDAVVDPADPYPVVAKAFGIDTVPFALYYQDRVLTAKAVVNRRDMLESLITGAVRPDGDDLIEASGGVRSEPGR